MIKECYVFSKYNVDAAYELMNIIQDFPCFVETKDVDEEWIEITIKCRKEDIASIEKRLGKVI